MGTRRHQLRLGSGQGPHSYSPCNKTNHGPLYHAAHGHSHQVQSLDPPRAPHQFHHNCLPGLTPFQEQVLRAEFRGKEGAQGLA